eukprot:gene1947-1455_t
MSMNIETVDRSESEFNATPSTPNTSDIIRSLDKFGSALDNQDEHFPLEDETDTNDELTETFEVVDIDVPSVENQSSSPKSDSSFSLTDVLKSACYGGMDGVSSIFVTVATVFSGNAGMTVVLIIGFAKLMSGAISMGIGDFMASKAELDLIAIERKRELWECENFLKGEKDEMIDIYENKGLNRETASSMVELMSENKQAFVDVMMVQELGLKPVVDPWGPLKNGLINFGSFILFGIIPLLIYIIITPIFIFMKHEASQPAKIIIFSIDIIITFVTLGLNFHDVNSFSDSFYGFSSFKIFGSKMVYFNCIHSSCWIDCKWNRFCDCIFIG